MKVTLLPEQIDVADGLTETDGVTEVAVIEIILLVAVDVVVQLALEVMVTFTWSPFDSVPEVKVGELAPTFTPFICH